MNILFEISDKDLMILGIGFVCLIVFSAIIIFIIKKDRTKVEEEPIKEEMFPEIKPLTEEQKEAKEELERVFKQMSEDLEAKKEQQSIDRFEQEQEENAIISYTQLMKEAEKLKETPVQDMVKKDIDFSCELDGIEEAPIMKKIDDNKEKHFKNSEIISPIFGIQKETKTKTKYDKEKESNSEFLNSLKEFRGNL